MAESVIDQLVYYNVRNIELDLRPQPPESILGPRLEENDWYVYHTPFESKRCRKLSDFLRLIRAFHDAAPQHEVITLTLEFKGCFDGVNNLPCFDPASGEDPTRETPAGLDALLRAHLGSSLFTPADLLASCSPRPTTLQDAVAACGWPTLETLRGRIIVNVLAGNLAPAACSEDDLTKRYAPSNGVANTRVAFAAPLDLWWRDFSEWGKRPWVVAHTEVLDVDRARQIRANPRFSAHILRSGAADDPSTFQKQQAHHNLIMTDHISWHLRPWSRTHNQFGYPFAPVGVVGDLCWTGSHKTSLLEECLSRLEIEVACGDIDKKHDSFAFWHTSGSNTKTVWTALISSASNNTIHGFAKGCLMARETLSDSSPYYAVGIAGDNHHMFIQYRSPGCPDGPCGTAHVEAPQLSNCDPEDAHFAKLEMTPLPAGGVRVQGFGSSDGFSWRAIGTAIDFPSPLPLQGIAASSNEPDKRNPDGTLTKFVFVNLRLNGLPQNRVTLPNRDKIGDTPLANFRFAPSDPVCPSNISVPKNPNRCGATVSFPRPAGACDMTCSPASGSFFPVGATTVTCNTSAAASCSFTVTVIDNDRPSITCPADVVGQATPGGSSAIVNYKTPIATDDCPVTVSCNPPSGSSFAVGVTAVTCTATDASGNTSACTFRVHVFNFVVRDDRTGSYVRIAYMGGGTASYQVFDCRKGVSFSGTAVVQRSTSCKVEFSDKGPDPKRPDRDVLVLANTCTLAGTAQVRKPDIALNLSLNDSDISNNSINCP